ncbi:hypothetical protein PG997_009937 [Apiospora hydei]|uniref:Uncharacterized protein n=1 Tax=Apiospora hydei TaxID=1337664 RepID=A0ABR1VZC1_9PEZI
MQPHSLSASTPLGSRGTTAIPPPDSSAASSLALRRAEKAALVEGRREPPVLVAQPMDRLDLVGSEIKQTQALEVASTTHIIQRPECILERRCRARIMDEDTVARDAEISERPLEGCAGVDDAAEKGLTAAVQLRAVEMRDAELAQRGKEVLDNANRRETAVRVNGGAAPGRWVVAMGNANTLVATRTW